MQIRTCWTALESKAEGSLEQLQGNIVKARQVRSTLEASQQRLNVLYEEYRANTLTAQDLCGMRDAMNNRQFMTQLLTLRDRLAQDIVNSTRHLQMLHNRMLLLEAERLKMKTLRENDHHAVQAFKQQREQRQMDEVGVMLFNRSGKA
jgi:flagellar export protein FliJ